MEVNPPPPPTVNPSTWESLTWSSISCSMDFPPNLGREQQQNQSSQGPTEARIIRRSHSLVLSHALPRHYQHLFFIILAQLGRSKRKTLPHERRRRVVPKVVRVPFFRVPVVSAPRYPRDWRGLQPFQLQVPCRPVRLSTFSSRYPRDWRDSAISVPSYTWD